MNIDLRKIKNSIQSRPDLINTLQQVSREISDNNKFQLYHNFLARLRAVVNFKSTILLSSSQHNLRMHFLVQSISQRILVNLIVTNRSSLVLKFENVANTDFSATPFFGDRDHGNFGYIPFLSVYNHVWCLNRGFLTR